MCFVILYTLYLQRFSLRARVVFQDYNNDKQRLKQIAIREREKNAFQWQQIKRIK